MLPLEAVLCHSQLIQLSKVDMLVVFFHPVLDRLATVPSIDQNTCTGDVVHTQSSHVFQAILNRTKEAGDLPWWQASTIKVVSRQHVAYAFEDHMGGSLYADCGWILLQPSNSA